jgi:phenylacetate-CoA ligase
MTVNVEHAKNQTAIVNASAELAQKIKTHVGVSAKVNVLAPGSIARSEGKATRVIDNR